MYNCPGFKKIIQAWTRGIYLISVSQISCNSQVIRDGTLVIINKTILATTWGNQYFCFDCKRKDENGNMPPSQTIVLLEFDTLTDLEKYIKAIYYSN